MKSCELCNELFFDNTQSKNKRFCSQQCTIKNNVRRNRERYQQKKKGDDILTQKINKIKELYSIYNQ